MTKYKSIIKTILLATGLLATSTACRDDDSRTAPTEENITPILHAANRDIRRVLDAPDLRERERILLDIRAKEYALRSQRLNNSADIYITHIRATLDTATLNHE